MQVPDVNYSCCLQTEPVANSSQNKGDADIGLLVACKVQLSSEVIRWKTESLRLQKECSSTQHRNKELDQLVSELISKTKDLEARLTQAEEESKCLKLKSMKADDEKSNSLQKLSQSLNKYHSFPASINSRNAFSMRLLPSGTPDPQKNLEVPQEALKELSQKMLKQMEAEFRELQEINSCFSSSRNANNLEAGSSDSDCREEFEKIVSTIVLDAESLKNHLLDQRRKLHSLIKNISQRQRSSRNTACVGKRTVDPLTTNNSSHSAWVQESSDKVFSNHFTEQLEGLLDLQVVRNDNNWDVDEDLTIHSPVEQNTNSLLVDKQGSAVGEDRVCPICQEQFSTAIPQAEFEEHVFNHLEAESVSLLEQYVVL